MGTNKLERQDVGLDRSLGLTLITLYGLGNILGAGIYVLVGEVVGAAGMGAPLAFVIAAVIAALTAFSYGELASQAALLEPPAISPDGNWLFVNIQTPGVSFAITGPWERGMLG